MHDIDTTLAHDLAGAPSAAEKVTLLFDYMRRRGQSHYDETVTQLAHGLQAAHFARQSGRPAHEVTSALLHDIGHLLVDEHEAAGEFLNDDFEHEVIGAEMLKAFFGPEVFEPIRLHVPAKRYLCTVDPAYIEDLSPASKRSFELQGGIMNDDERAAFEANPYYESAVLLRRWDDAAKVEGMDVPGLEEYRKDVAACLK